MNEYEYVVRCSMPLPGASIYCQYLCNFCGFYDAVAVSRYNKMGIYVRGKGRLRSALRENDWKHVV